MEKDKNTNNNDIKKGSLSGINNLKPSKTNKKSIAGIEILKPKPNTNPQGSQENKNNNN